VFALIATELQSRINRAIKQTEQNYQKALRELSELKAKINDLELAIIDNAHAKTTEHKEKLDSAMDRLIKFTDMMISESERRWEEYRVLERDCETSISKSSDVNAQMKTLMDLCKKTDELATDLLCYSLAHFKRLNENIASAPDGDYAANLSTI
jgi:predicted  nucleic acid-binding Zn-ribbon protein